jgi:hypothetical protein
MLMLKCDSVDGKERNSFSRSTRFERCALRFLYRLSISRNSQRRQLHTRSDHIYGAAPRSADVANKYIVATFHIPPLVL